MRPTPRTDLPARPLADSTPATPAGVFYYHEDRKMTQRTLFFDYETFPFRPGLTVPRAVCLGFAWDDDVVKLTTMDDGAEQIRQALYAQDALLVGHNVFFDLLVWARQTGDLAAVFGATAQGRVRCTQIRYKLLRLAKDGKLMSAAQAALDSVAREYRLPGASRLADLKRGGDSWRKRYNELARTPIHLWPSDAVDYPIADVENTRAIYHEQTRMAREGFWVDGVKLPYVPEHDDTLVHDEERHSRADLALKLMGAWGVRVDAGRLRVIERETRRALEQAATDCVRDGLMDAVPGGHKKNTKAIKAIVSEALARRAEAEGIDLEVLQLRYQTPGGDVSTNKATLEAVDDPRLGRLLLYRKLEKLLTTYLEPFAAGTRNALCVGYDVLKETGRTSSFAPNIQNLPRSGGLRECLEPRPGYVFVISDLDSIELRAWATVCEQLFGHSTMADSYRATPDFDPHAAVAAQILGVSQAEGLRLKAAKDPAFSDARQLSKPVNFGLPGGMGAESFVSFAKGYGVPITLDKSKWLKDQWKATWAEAAKYLKWVGDQIKDQGGDKATIKQIGSGRLRAGCMYTQAANSLFQGLTADGCKLVLWRLAVECYLDVESPLFGSRPIAFIHDEFVLESPEDKASGAADRLALVMQEEMEKVISVPVRTTPCVSRRWAKKAESTRGPDGRWTVWAPAHEEAVDVEALAAFDDVEDDA